MSFTATDRGVRDLPQQASLSGRQITLTSRVGRSVAATRAISLDDWEKAERHPNPNYGRIDLIRKLTVGMDDEPGGPAQADRIRDSMVRAIGAAISKSKQPATA